MNHAVYSTKFFNAPRTAISDFTAFFVTKRDVSSYAIDRKDNEYWIHPIKQMHGYEERHVFKIEGNEMQTLVTMTSTPLDDAGNYYWPTGNFPEGALEQCEANHVKWWGEYIEEITEAWSLVLSPSITMSLPKPEPVKPENDVALAEPLPTDPNDERLKTLDNPQDKQLIAYWNSGLQNSDILKIMPKYTQIRSVTQRIYELRKRYPEILRKD